MDEKEKDVSARFIKTASIAVIIVSVIYMIVLKSFHIFIVDGESMSPSFIDGEILYGAKAAEDNVKKNDVIIFKKGVSSYIKRVVATSGDVVEIIDGYLYVNGEVEKAKYPVMFDAGILTDSPLTIGQGEYFCLGDNRNNSKDSREIGVVYQQEIKSIVKGFVLKKSK